MAVIHEWQRTFAGEETWLTAVIETAYAECVELQATSLSEAFKRIADSAEAIHRMEYRCTVNGNTVAVAVIAEHEDMHVGKCWGIQWFYCKPEFRNTGSARRVMHRLKLLAKLHKTPYSYTKRLGAGKYLQVYGGYHRKED